MQEFPKRRYAACILAVFLVLMSNETNGDLLETVAMIIKFATEVQRIISETSNDLNSDRTSADEGSSIYQIQLPMDNEEVLKKLSELSDKIDAFEENWEIRSTVAFENIIRRIHQQNQLSDQLRELNNRITKVSRLYRLFQRYSKSPKRYEKATLTEFSWETVSFHDGILDSLEVIHNLIIPDTNGFRNQNLLNLLVDSLQLENGRGDICDSRQSTQQMVYDLYNSIAVNEIKGYAIMQFSWMLLKVYKLGNFTQEMQLTKESYETRMVDTAEAIRVAMASASRDLWKCDPPYPRGPDTSTELTRLLPGIVVNEVDLSSSGSCRQNCAWYDYARVHRCFDTDHCSVLRQCNGGVYRCQYVGSDMLLCPAESNSARRYNHIQYDNGLSLGKEETCNRGYHRVDSWWRWLFWHCSYCICFCDDDTVDSDRYFSLRNVVADVQANKVITGLKFVKVNKVIHLQIEQGELLERGKIGNNAEWKPVDEFSPLDYSTRDGTDYWKLEWNYRNLDLDSLEAPPGYLLTGVRFGVSRLHLNFEIRMTPFNFSNGVLVKNMEKSMWSGNYNTVHSNSRKLIELSEPDRSTNSRLPSIPDFRPNRYIQFGPTNWEKDIAQSTVPFIDTQSVVSYPRVPLAGAGIYYKGRSGYGGYIAPKVTTYNFAPHLRFLKSVPSVQGDIIETSNN